MASDNPGAVQLTIRKLRKHGVEVVSTTQPTGTDPSQELMRQIIGVFDEYTSRENGKNVSRAMRESAKQGFWNGATPPLGYRIVEAERRGTKVKKRLAIDPVNAELVRLIFKLYLQGDGGTGPLGVKGVTVWLNDHGYRTRKGATFGVGPVHGILTNRCYATGKWPYGVRSSRTGERYDPSSIVEIDVPTIVSRDQFDQVQARLSRNNPMVTPPRVVNGPTLLTGLASCGTCGFGMTLTGTRRRDRHYRYYSCAGCKLGGKSVCSGRHVPMEKLDRLVIEGVADKLLTPHRVEEILGALSNRAAAKDRAVAERRHQLEAELGTIRSKLSRLYSAIEEGVIELDGDLKERISQLKTKREIAEASLEQIASYAAARTAITPQRVSAFTELMRNKLQNGDVRARKDWLGSILERIEVGDDTVKLIGNKQVLAAAVTSQNTAPAHVRGFVRKWRARQDSNLLPQD